MPKPIPVHTTSVVTRMAGTAFLVTNGTATWLVSCVHSFSNLKDTPADTQFFQGSEVRVVGGGPSIPLYSNGQKRFCVLTENATDVLWDIISVKLSAAEVASVTQFEAYHLDQISAPEMGAEIQISGFPGLAAAPIPSTTMTATITDIVGASIEFDEPSIPGWSGSPVEQNGVLIGMVHGDRGPPSAPCAGLAMNLFFFKNHLFV